MVRTDNFPATHFKFLEGGIQQNTVTSFSLAAFNHEFKI